MVTYDTRMIIVCVIFDLLLSHAKEYKYDTQNVYSKIINYNKKLANNDPVARHGRIGGFH